MHDLLLTHGCCAPVQSYHDNGQNYGTFLNLQSEKMITEVIGQTEWKVTTDRSQVRFDSARVQRQRRTHPETPCADESRVQGFASGMFTFQHCSSDYRALLTHAVPLQQVYDNRNGKVAFTRETSAEESETTVKEVTVTNAVVVGLEAGCEAFGVDVKISATFEHTNVRARRELLWLPKP